MKDTALAAANEAYDSQMKAAEPGKAGNNRIEKAAKEPVIDERPALKADKPKPEVSAPADDSDNDVDDTADAAELPEAGIKDDEEAGNIKDAEPEKVAKPDDDVKLPPGMPKEWAELLAGAEPGAKKLLIEKFKNGDRMIARKAGELNHATRTVETYLGALTKDLAPVIKERYQGSVPAFAADINRMVVAFNSPHEYVRREAVVELLKSVFPNGLSDEQGPDPIQRAMLEKQERIERMLAERAPQQTQQQFAAQQPQEARVVTNHLKDIARMNPEARKFMEDQSNAQLMFQKYQLLRAANPREVGANVIEAVLDAMKEKQSAGRREAQEDELAAKRERAARLPITGSRQARANGAAHPLNARDAVEQSWAELENRNRM